ncbi:uncharacterized protein [Coffea arabica]|uniref:RNase H type-1 domain-containing protein n=1 Tax=Coffea arabica TaxID=13443 RepID=A0A6P6T113_COFAR|nr:uncharacterized protein LOC113696506 [Coffea arabica]
MAPVRFYALVDFAREPVKPARESIFRRTKQGSPFCSRCGDGIETVEHILFHCQQAQKVWKLAPVQWDGLQNQTGCFKQWWTALVQARSRKGGRQHIALTANILWQLWKDRNDMEFERKERDGWKSVRKASTEWMEYEEAGIKKKEKSTPETDKARESSREEGRVEEGLMELQIATKKSAEGRKLGIGVVARQAGGRIRAEWKLVERSSGREIQDEAEAVRLVLLKARQLSWQRIKIINANKQLIALLKSGKGDNPNTATLVEDIQALANLFQMCSFEERTSCNMTLCNHICHYALSICRDEERFFGSP